VQLIYNKALHYAVNLKRKGEKEGKMTITMVAFLLTFDCIHSLSAMNSADPFPAQAIPLTKAVDAPDSIPNVKYLCKYTNS